MVSQLPVSSWHEVVRGAVMGVKENAYFQAAEAAGARRPWTLVRHVLPNIAAPLIVIFSINVGSAIIAEASLSFLGFGLPVNVPSWGGMLSREGRRYMELAPRLALWPGLFLTVTVYCLNMVGDAARDLLDPRRQARDRPPRPPCPAAGLSNGSSLSITPGVTAAFMSLDYVC